MTRPENALGMGVAPLRGAALVEAVRVFLERGTYVTMSARGPSQVVRDVEFCALCEAYEAATKPEGRSDV